MGEFEFALVFYHRGQKLRPQIQEFRLGIQKAQEAIENSVGSKWCVIVFWGLHLTVEIPYETSLENLNHLFFSATLQALPR